MPNQTPLIMVSAVPGIPDPEAFIPERKSDDAVGYDVKACHILDPMIRAVIGELPVTIEPGEQVLIGGGYCAAIPPGVDCQIRPRSGLAAKYNVILANGPGTVDPDFRGEIGLAMLNIGKKPFTIKRGDRIAQLVFTSVLLPEFYYVDNPSQLPATRRGVGGFGSTGIGATEGSGIEGYRAKQRALDVYYMQIALAIGRGSNCVRGCKMDERGVPLRDEHDCLIGATRKLGCIIVASDDAGIVSSGFNAQFPGSPLCANQGCIREKMRIPSGTQLEVCQAIHAEHMAMNNALRNGVRIDGCTMYCTAEPCRNCARDITGLRLEALVVINGGYGRNDGVDIVMQSGTCVRLLKMDEVSGPVT